MAGLGFSGDDFFEKMDLPELKKAEQQQRAKIDERHREISASIKGASKGVRFTPETKERFEKEFNRNRTKYALKWTIVSFVFVLAAMLFLQPSIFASSEGTRLTITNLAWRDVKDVSVYDMSDIRGMLNGSATPVLYLPSIKAGSQYSNDMNRYGFFLITASRQLPSAGFLVSEANPKTQTANNSQNDSIMQKFYDESSK